MEASMSNGPDGVKTFRGKSLEELLPQIRAELGPDAIVLRRREGTAGGVGGFFSRPYVEVDARAPNATERPLEIRTDRATTEGLSSPAVQALFEQATPFADALAAAARDSRMEEDTFSTSFADTFAPVTEPEAAQEPPRRMRDAAPPTPASPGLYGPQPNASAIADTDPRNLEPEDEPKPEPVAVAPEPEPDEPDEPVFEVPPAPVVASSAPAGISRPPSADAAEERLIAAGLSRGLAADVVGEAVTHGLPFSAPRNMKRLVRAALARRIPTPTAIGPASRTIAVIGGGGAGKSSAVAHLAAVYAAAGAEVAVIDLRGDHGLAGRLQPLGIGVITAQDATQAKERLAARQPVITLIDTPAAGPSTPAAEIKSLAADLRALGAEVHLALPATLSAAAAGELAAALASLAPTHIALTHADETSRPGAPLELALAAGRPLSYVCSRDGATPADAASLAAQLLP